MAAKSMQTKELMFKHRGQKILTLIVKKQSFFFFFFVYASTLLVG